ncbi:hypothetical protein C0431_12435 [bacterium]|nr:hypothetical protein [bacterium]
MLIDIGYYNYVNLEKIVGLKSGKEETKDDKLFYEEIKEQGIAVDATNGNKRRSYVMTSDGKVYVSNVRPETLYKRINGALGYSLIAEPEGEEDEE